jgi:tetratricopeptide (TPR) repeat protein
MSTHQARGRVIRKLVASGYPEAAHQECAGNANLLLQLGQFHLSMGRHAAARSIALELNRQSIEQPYQMDALAMLLTHCGEHGRALPHFARAVEAVPENMAFRYNLAMAQRRAGALQRAEANLDIILAANPLDGEAQNARSALRKQTRSRNHVPELQTALRSLKGRRGVVGIQFALAKELEDLGEYRRSFAHLSDGCRRLRASQHYEIGDDLAVLETLRRELSIERLARRKSSLTTDRPIFIVGLPHSGTALLERILSNHDEVISGGDLDVFPAALAAAVMERHGRPLSQLELIERSPDLNFDELGGAYMQATAERTGVARHFTDTFPLNYLYAGLIHAALPRATFVAIRRHPMDVCYAMYRTLFASSYHFTYDLVDIARYYVAWDQLMRHWETLIGGAWLTVHYEKLVLDREKYASRLLAYCGLAGEANTARVRWRLYTDTVGKWRSHALQLRPLRRYLEGHGIACGGPTSPNGYR